MWLASTGWTSPRPSDRLRLRSQPRGWRALPGSDAHPALLRWRKRGSGRRIFAAPGMTAELIRALDHPRDEGRMAGRRRRVQIVDRAGEPSGRHRLFL